MKDGPHVERHFKKILITGGLWTTSISRQIQTLFNSYTSSVEDGGEGLIEAAAVKQIAEELEISLVSISVTSSVLLWNRLSSWC